MPFETPVLIALPAMLNFAIKGTKTTYDLQQVPEETQALFKTIASTRQDIVSAKEERVDLAKAYGSEQLAEWDRAVQESEAALADLEKLVEPVRLNVEHNQGKINAKTKMLWVLRDSSTRSAKVDRLNLANQRLHYVMLKTQMRHERGLQRYPSQKKNETVSPPSYASSEALMRAVNERREDDRTRMAARRGFSNTTQVSSGQGGDVDHQNQTSIGETGPSMLPLDQPRQVGNTMRTNDERGFVDIPQRPVGRLGSLDRQNPTLTRVGTDGFASDRRREETDRLRIAGERDFIIPSEMGLQMRSTPQPQYQSPAVVTTPNLMSSNQRSRQQNILPDESDGGESEVSESSYISYRGMRSPPSPILAGETANVGTQGQRNGFSAVAPLSNLNSSMPQKRPRPLPDDDAWSFEESPVPNADPAMDSITTPERPTLAVRNNNSRHDILQTATSSQFSLPINTRQTGSYGFNSSRPNPPTTSNAPLPPVPEHIRQTQPAIPLAQRAHYHSPSSSTVPFSHASSHITPSRPSIPPDHTSNSYPRIYPNAKSATTTSPTISSIRRKALNTPIDDLLKVPQRKSHGSGSGSGSGSGAGPGSQNESIYLPSSITDNDPSSDGTRTTHHSFAGHREPLNIRYQPHPDENRDIAPLGSTRNPRLFIPTSSPALGETDPVLTYRPYRPG